ncbi:MAG TPA: ester cyclase [Acidimicrobiia bacterium]|nr:ester cyclase [Acidimicrobiia bacterium]
METDENRALIERIYRDGYNGGDVRVYDECYADDFVHHSKTIHDVAGGAVGERESMQRFRAAIPDAHFEVLDLTAEGDRVAARLRITGTPATAFGDITPTGGPIEIDAVAWFRVRDGRVTEEWFYVDSARPPS